jgi:Undecaprenyl-phosphate galactose phosphotransferase WbaP
MVTNSAGRKCAECPIPVVTPEQLLASEPDRFAGSGIQTVLIDSDSAFGSLGKEAGRNLLRLFRHMIFVSDMDWLEGASIRIHDYEGLMGIEAQKNALSPLETGVKRVMDVILSITLCLISLPLMLLAAITIWLDSPGEVFYKQERVGRHGRPFKVYKFRTMQQDADSMLVKHLESNSEAMLEWRQNQKLQDDPRVTPIGRILRRYSIDELPQLFNVLRGEMSLVGPRPIVDAEVPRYSTNFDVYSSLRPGITGLWQVTGRNNASYDERVHFDVYYVRNWSIWLDLYILFRTIWVVISRDGAF